MNAFIMYISMYIVGVYSTYIPYYARKSTTIYTACTGYTHNARICTCILVRRKIKEKSVHTSALETQVTDVCTVHQTGFIVGINCMRTRQEISKHISIAYNMLYWTMRIFAV